ncbi:MAG: response regulator [Promethearchaeota archaeon]|nr:MAG: response regulator [Candidatus Lokiarchaeota archaeon]
MPLMEGVEMYHTMENLNSNPLQFPNPPILYMSGYSLNTSYMQKQKIKSERFIQKPFSIDELLTKIRSILDSN